MTTLGTLATPAGRANGKNAATPFDLGRVLLEVAVAVSRHNLTASITPGAVTAAVDLGTPPVLRAALEAWTNQDDDAHEPCSLTACRHPLHPGPCKGWKGTLHAVAPGTYTQIENERVRKANERRLKRIADLKAQNKPIPRRLLDEIKPKAAPAHPAHNAAPVPLGQVGQKADLAGGQAHHASQAISKAAGVVPKVPLPLGPKQKKPTVAGRGPAFVITQPKVTDQYKLDKAAKITPQEWDALSAADKTAIRTELTAIKARGFGPQQTKADILLAKLPAASTVGTLKPGTPGTITTPQGNVHQVINPQPGKVSLGQASKTIPGTPAAKASSRTQAQAALNIAEAIFGKQNADLDKMAKTFDDLKAKSASGEMDQRSGFKLLVDRLANAALKQASADKMPNNPGITAFNHEIRDHILEGKTGVPPLVKRMQDHHENAKRGLPGLTPPAAAPTGSRGNADPAEQARKAAGSVSLSTSAKTFVYRKLDKAQFDGLDDTTKKRILADLDDQVANGAPTSKKLAADLKDRFAPKTTSAVTPAASPSAAQPGAAKALSPDAQHARAVAGRAVGRPTSKAHLDAYGKLTKDDFDSLDSTTQRTIRDDLANAKAKFLDPAKQKTAQDLLDRFGAKHTTPAPGAPATPAHPKGYSHPQSEAVKAASGGSTDLVLQRVGALSRPSIDGLDDADRKTVLTRLAFIATHPKATPDQKAQAAAYGRIINKGPLTPIGKLDHEPSLGELHAHERRTGAAQKLKDAEMAADALKGAEPSSTSGWDPATRIVALTALSKTQFDTLDAADQRKIIDALQSLHLDKSDPYNTKIDKTVGAAITTYTGKHPAMHRLQQAEEDFRAGKISGNQMQAAFYTSRVQAPGTTDKAAHAAVLAEAARIAKDNPTLPPSVRAMLAGEPKYGDTAYAAIALARMAHNWEPAPRLSAGDFRDLFGATDTDLAAADPIHAQAVRDLQEHVLTTGLASGSPWSDATKNAATDAFLQADDSGEIPRDRLDRFNNLPSAAKTLMIRAMRERMASQTSDTARTRTWISVRQMEGAPKFFGAKQGAVLAAARVAPPRRVEDSYLHLDPQEYDELPNFVQRSISTHLDRLQMQAEQGGPTRTWSPQENLLKVLPAALNAHLRGSRTQYSDRRMRHASDIANYGQDVISPLDRIRAYGEIPSTRIRDMSPADLSKISADLDGIANNTSHSGRLRYEAQFTKDISLQQGTLSLDQIKAVGIVHPTATPTSQSVFTTFNDLTKADFDQLHPAYRQAIDDRIKTMSGSDQQYLNAKFHPAAAAANPSGVTPTTVQANVPPHVQAALDTIYGAHPKSHTMAHQLSTYGALRGSDFNQLNAQEQSHLLSDLSFIQTTAKGPSANKAKLLIDRFTPPGTPSGQIPTPAVIPPANAVAGQVRHATPLKGVLVQAKDKGTGGDGWTTTPGGKRVWGKYGAAGLLLMHQDPATGERRYLMVQRGPAISDPGKWQFPGGAIDSKETFHQGGTREVIEELGFKADALKDAEVHGEHTNGIPGSTWKYVSIAAQVPQMLKPDLSTHHARAETSDAKWMTEAEIRKLDTDGKLLAPLAGGKLEQNVMSLFPSTISTKLGQVARPGPVTKRLGRLAMPSGGRQAPAQFNAWPHPHKQSKGKNLIPDKASFDAMRQTLKTDRKIYDGKTADGRLAAIGAKQGFDDTPTVVDKKEIDRLLATGDYIEVWRGVSGIGGWSARGRGASGTKTAAAINEEMRSGPAYYGKGIFGNGYYLATQRSVASQYADGTKGSIMRMLIPKTALTEKYDKVSKESFASSSRNSQAKGAGWGETSTFWDPGRYAAAKGLDGIEIEPHHVSPQGGARHVAAPGKPAFNWLNRSVLIVQKEPG